MVPIELQRTHMSFDGLGDVFGALGFDTIVREVERCQRPDGMDGAVLAKFTSGMACDLLALGQERGHNNRTRSTQLSAAEVSFGHIRLHGDNLLIAEGDAPQRPDGGMDGAGLAKCISRWCGDLLALRQKGGNNNRTRSTQLFAAEVSFGHDGLHGDSLLVAKGDDL